MYTTDAIVCGWYPEREHDVSVRLYTKDAGMLYARAAGARAAQSKLRYALQDFSFSRVSLVRGRYDWRITGAVSVQNFYFNAQKRTSRALLLATMRTVRRLIQGSVMSEELFVMVAQSMETFAAKEFLPFAEDVFSLRLLYQLGYVAPGIFSKDFLASGTMEDAYQQCLTEVDLQEKLAQVVEDALVVSHL